MKTEEKKRVRVPLTALELQLLDFVKERRNLRSIPATIRLAVRQLLDREIPICIPNPSRPAQKPLVAFRREFLLDCLKKCKYVEECPLIPPKQLTSQETIKWLEKKCFQVRKLHILSTAQR